LSFFSLPRPGREAVAAYATTVVQLLRYHVRDQVVCHQNCRSILPARATAPAKSPPNTVSKNLPILLCRRRQIPKGGQVMDPGLLRPSVTLSPSHFTNTKVRIPTQSSTSKVYNFFKVSKFSLHHAVFPNKPLSLPVSFSLCFRPRGSPCDSWFRGAKAVGPSSFLATGVFQYPFVLAVTLGSVAVPVLPFFPVFFLRLIWPGVGKKKLMPAFVFFFPTFSGSDVTMSTRGRTPPRFFLSPCDGGSF
jgi:hypothetical protein